MKNPLLDAYNQVLTEQAEKPGVNAPSKAKPAPDSTSTLTNPSKQTVGDLDNDDELFGEKPEVAKNCGPESVKLDKQPAAKSTADYLPNKPAKPVKAGENTPKVEEPEEKEETSQADKKFVPFKKKDTKEFKESMKPVSAFETLFKKTLVEEFGEEIPDDLSGDADLAPEDTDLGDLEDEVEDVVDGEEEETDEVGDLVADLNDLKAKIEAILDKVGGDLEDGEEIEPLADEAGEEYTEDDFDEEFDDSDDEEGAVKESVKASKLAASKGKKLMSKSNKVGKLSAKGGKASVGKLRCEPKPKALGQKGSKLQGAKSKPEVKSSVKKGDCLFK